MNQEFDSLATNISVIEMEKRGTFTMKPKDVLQEKISKIYN